MKQVLSVADFAIILELINHEILSIKEMYCHKLGNKDDFFVKWASVEDGRVQKALLNDTYYQDLLHLKNLLQNLNIEVETPNVEITHQHEDKGE